jgi:glutaredoxin
VLPKRIVLYARPGCHLCEEVEGWLLEIGASWKTIDITADTALFERYRYRIPVVEVDRREVLCAPITRADVRRALGESLGIC